MKKIALVNGSPRGKNSCSQGLTNEINKMLQGSDVEAIEICVADIIKSNAAEEAFKELSNMNSIIFIFPLYVDALPSSLLEFMISFQEFLQRNQVCKTMVERNKPTVYAIANCGFIEGSQNKHALKIVENFAKRLGMQWRFGIGVGAGEFMRSTETTIPIESGMKSKIHEAFKLLEKDIKGTLKEEQKNILTNPAIPRMLFMFSGNRYWITEAKKNAITKKQLYARPVV